MKEKIIESAKLMGMSESVDMNVIFNNMTKLVEMMKEQLDNPEEAE
jgi:hypothetical protein